MARTAVVDLDIQGGRRLIEALDAAGVAVHSAFWLLDTDSEEWRLVIATPMVDKNGPLKTYEAIQPVLQSLSDVGFRIDNIAAVGTNDSIVKLLRSAVHTGPGIGGIRITRNVINGTLIEDAYIYRLQ